MGFTGPRLAIGQDEDSITLETVVDDSPLAHLIFDGRQVEELITTLSVLRAKLKDSVPREPPVGASLGVYDLVWRSGEIETQAVDGSKQSQPALRLRHPGIGWLSFVFPPQEATAISQWLLLHAKTPEKPS